MRDDEREVQLFFAGSGHEATGIPRDLRMTTNLSWRSLGRPLEALASQDRKMTVATRFC